MSIKFAYTVQQYYDCGNAKPSDIDELREYLKGLGMPSDSDELLLVFYMAARCDMEAAKKYASVHYRGRKDVPEVFSNRKLTLEGMRQQWDVIEFAVMPKRTETGCAVLLFRLVDPVPAHFKMDILFKLLLMCIDSVFHDEPVTGFIAIGDLKNMSLMHMARLQLSILKRMLKYAGEGLFCHLRAAHFINGGFVLDKLFKIFKAFSSKELFSLMQFHPASMKMEDFHKNHVPKKYLPCDYGGDGESMTVLHQAMWKKMEDLGPFYEQEYNQRRLYDSLSE